MAQALESKSYDDLWTSGSAKVRVGQKPSNHIQLYVIILLSFFLCEIRGFLARCMCFSSMLSAGGRGKSLGTATNEDVI